MISLLAAHLFQASYCFELIDPSAKEIAITAVTKLPAGFGDHDRQVLAIVVQTLTRGTADYSRKEAYLVTEGWPVQCRLLNDSVMLQVSAPKANWKRAVSYAQSLCRYASLTQLDIDNAVRRNLRAESPYWQVAVNPIHFSVGSIRHEEADAVYHRVFNPLQTTVVIGGPLVSGEAVEEWQNKTADWTPAPEPNLPDDSKPNPLNNNPSGVTTAELAGPEFTAGDVALPIRLLALYALGTGKASSLHRILRETHGWSYRQESIMSPTPSGWQPRLIWAEQSGSDTKAHGEALQAELLKDIEAWDDSVEDRAYGMAVANLSTGVPLGPIGLLGYSPTQSLEDRVAMTAYWRMKQHEDWDIGKLLNGMKLVRLSELKETATEIVSKAQLRVLPGL